MLERYARAIRRMDDETELGLRRYMAERGVLLYEEDLLLACEQARLCQADVVLCLLRLNTRRSLRAAELLVGRPITHCPPMLALRWQPPRLAAERQRSGDERRVVRVRKPKARERGRRRLLTCGMYERIALVTVGMTIRHAVLRGVRRRDLRVAVRRGYLVLEG